MHETRPTEKRPNFTRCIYNITAFARSAAVLHFAFDKDGVSYKYNGEPINTTHIEWSRVNEVSLKFVPGIDSSDYRTSFKMKAKRKSMQRFLAVQMLLPVFLVILTNSSCKERPSSTLQHATNSGVRSKDSWQWREITFEDYQRVVLAGYNIKSEVGFIADTNDPLVQRAQFWIDEIDQRLRKNSPDDFKNVPKPRAVVWSNPEANAFVSPVTVCLNMQVVLNPEIKVSADNTIDAISLDTAGFVRPEDSSTPCVKSSLTEPDFEKLILWFNANNMSCKLSLDDSTTGERLLRVAKNCPMASDLTGVAKARQALLTTTTNWITINTGLFTQFPTHEWMVVPTLAHELGHYYRSHMTVFDQDFGYYFNIKNKTEPGKPELDSNLSERGALVTQASHYLTIPSLHEQQKIHAITFNLITRSVRSICERESKDCKKSCGTLDQMFSSGQYLEDFGDLLSDPLTDENIIKFQQFEKLAEECAKKIQIVSGVSHRGVSRAEIKSAFAEFNRLFEEPRVSTLFDAAMNFRNQLNGLQSKSTNIVQSAERDGLVRYTIELEADEFAFEQFIGLGYSFNNWITSEVVFNRSDDDSADSEMELCEKAWNNTWIDSSGASFIPERGGFYELHPKPCFRSYNLYLENQLHSYNPSVNNKIVAPSTYLSWSVIVQTASSRHRVLANPTNESPLIGNPLGFDHPIQHRPR